MTRNPRKELVGALVAAGLGMQEAGAVYLNPDGYGQALIYPYYTAQNSGGDSWNTYISVVNHQADAKVVRVSVREGRNGRAVANFNVYLAPNDVWTGAVLPSATSEGARFITNDSSCTNPDVLPSGNDFRNAAFSGANTDGLGEGLDRTREGYVEIIEMATLTGAAAIAVTPREFYEDRDCAQVQGPDVPLAGTTQPPTGGLSGTLTLINVNSGMDAAVNAIALADLTSLPFYRNYNDPYPDFDAIEVRPVSHIMANGKSYQLDWTRGVDAVSSVLMSPEVLNEYVLDRNTRSQTDWIATYPTRRFYGVGESPFAAFDYYELRTAFFDRSSRGATAYGGGSCHGFLGSTCTTPVIKAASVVPVNNFMPASLVGAHNRMDELGETTNSFESGWRSIELVPNAAGFGRMTSLPTSTATDHASGIATGGSFLLSGLPTVGFMVRTFQNGTLNCATGSCQGNYGGAFPHRYRRSIEPITAGP